MYAQYTTEYFDYSSTICTFRKNSWQLTGEDGANSVY